MKKSIITFMSFFLLLPALITPQSVSAQTTTEEPVETEETYELNEAEKQKIENDMEFYFSEVGYINQNGEYIVTDVDALEQDFSNHGIELTVHPEYQVQVAATNSVVQYGICVVANSLPVPFSGTAYQVGLLIANDSSFIEAITQGAVDTATEILFDYVRSELPSLAGELTNFSLVTNVAVALVSCGLN